jgi:fatty acid desaturase
MRIRAQYNATGTDRNPYLLKGRKPSKVAVRIGVLYLLALVVTLPALYLLTEDWWLMPAAAGGLWTIVSVVFLLLPDDKFHQSKLQPVIHPRYTSALRVGFITGVLTGLALITRLTGAPAFGYFLVLWVVPLFTSFAFFMILRQLVQHGNGGRGWINNTRTFLLAPFIRFAVFPHGQDYHLPHHMYATVPHFRLKSLHELLMKYPEYRAEALEVHGYFASPERPQIHPTVIDVLGQDYAPRTGEIHIDAEAVSVAEFKEAEGLAAEIASSTNATSE